MFKSLMTSCLRLATIVFVAVLSLATAGCGAEEDPVDMTAKPPVPGSYLGDFDELVTTDLVAGTGEAVGLGDNVEMHYVGVLGRDGSEFDSSWERGEPIPFILGAGRVIPGWDQGIVGMAVGGRRVLQIPSELAYGSQARGEDIPADSDLVFIVDLVGAEFGPDSPEIPEDALGPVDSLETIDLVEGSGEAVAVGDIVDVQYLGVNADDGVEFDSTWSRGATPYRLVAGSSMVIEGWQEGIVGMRIGGERVLRIPADLAYGTDDLVFRIHLEEIQPAPLAHTLTFEGAPPAEPESTTLVDGEGEGAEFGQAISAYTVVIRHSDSKILQSTYLSDAPVSLFLTDDGDLNLLNQSLVGTKAGEVRQVVMSAEAAFPDGIPEGAGVEAGDGLVFVVDAIELQDGE